MITTETIIYPEEYWMNSQLATARFFGGCIIKGKEYVIVNKEGVSMQKLADKAKIGDVLIPAGEPANLILKEWQPIYRALGRDAFIEHLKINQDLEKAKKYVKQLKSKEK
jgi:hypothetical protein